MNKDDIENILNEMHLLNPEELAPKARKLFDTIMSIADERDKYKALYENEKDHSNTLVQIIDKIVSSDKDKIIYKELKDEGFLKPPYKITCETGDN